MARKNHQQFDDLGEKVSELSRQLDSIYTALVIRDPGTPISAETYEGLRRQIIAGAQERLAHLVQLTEFDVALRSGADVETLGRLVNSWLTQAGVGVVVEPGDDLQFEAVTGDGPWEVALPAYVDVPTGRTIRQGRLQKATGPTEPDSELTDGETAESVSKPEPTVDEITTEEEKP